MASCYRLYSRQKRTGHGCKTHHVSSDADAQLAAFLSNLSSTVPCEWSVAVQPVFDNNSSSSQGKLPAMMHPAAVGTQDGIMCFGGMRLGLLEEIKVENDASWVKEEVPAGRAPDCSRVYQGTPSHAARQVVRVCPSSSKPGAPWAAHPVSPSLDGGLLGHSVAVWGHRAFIFGGLQEFPTKDPSDGKARRPTNQLRAYALCEAGTQGGLLPALSEVPQLGAVPSCRMYHSAAVDSDAGVMYVYGGVSITASSGGRVPADSEAGLLHAFDFSTYTWSTISTTGPHRPCSTTLLAFFWHAGALWAIPDLPAPDGSRRAAKMVAAGYQLLRLDMASMQWEQVASQGPPPSPRTDACSVYNACSQELMVYGGRSAQAPYCLLADLHILCLPDASAQQHQGKDRQQQQHHQQPAVLQPVWQQLQPKRCCVAAGGEAGGQQQLQLSQLPQQQQHGMLPLAGHAGGVVGGTGEVAFVGGYRRSDVKVPQPLLQVLRKSVKPPTPDVAQVAPLVLQQQLALQHIRMQLARMVKAAHPAQVLLKPDGAGVRLPARLLALYSCLFDDLFQAMLGNDEEADQQAAGSQQQQQVLSVVPVPGVQQDSIAAVCRWMMGLLALASCSVKALIDMYRVADRLVMEALMVEVLEELAGRTLLPDEAAQVMALAGDFPGAGGELRRSAARQLQQQVSASTAPAIMALARQQGNQELQERCVEAMSAHRKNNVFAVLDFALRFNLRSLQGSCLGSLRRISRDRLVDWADRVVQVVTRRLLPGQRLGDVPAVQMLERDLVNELEASELQGLPCFAGVSERLQLAKLRQGIVDYCCRQAVWQQLHSAAHKSTLERLQQRHARLWTLAVQQRGRTGQAGPRTEAAGAALNLLGAANPDR